MRDRYRGAHAEVAALERELEELRELEGTRERDLDLMRFELAEIEAAAPDPAEESELAAESERLRHADVLRAAAAGALGALDGAAEDGDGARAAMGGAESGLAGVDGFDAELDGLAERLRSAAMELDELARDLRGYLDRSEAEPGRLEVVQERLEVLDRLKRKHGGSLEAVIAHGEHCRAEIDRLVNSAEVADQLGSRIAAAQAARAELAERLSAERRDAGERLTERVAAELADLAMDGARLEVAFEPHPDGFGPNGPETVELLVATNPGLPTSPLRDAASGGELSRIMLALIGLGARTGERTLVFDEVDAGIGGFTARAVGERLRALAAERQLICITHLPQVAALAETHFRIEKSTVRQRGPRDRRTGGGRRAGRRDRAHARRRARRRRGQHPRTRAARSGLAAPKAAAGRE